MNTQITSYAAHLAVGAVSIGGAATTIPLVPILIGVGLVAGTVMAVSCLNSSTKIQLAKLQTTSGDGKFFIQSYAGDYCTAELNWGSRLTSNRKIVQDWEHFEMLKAVDGRVAFRASNNNFVCADRNRGGLLVADRQQVSDWELFTLEEHGPFVALKSSDGNYVSRREDDKTLLKATAPAAREWELFRVMKMA